MLDLLENGMWTLISITNGGGLSSCKVGKNFQPKVESYCNTPKHLYVQPNMLSNKLYHKLYGEHFTNINTFAQQCRPTQVVAWPYCRCTLEHERPHCCCSPPCTKIWTHYNGVCSAPIYLSFPKHERPSLWKLGMCTMDVANCYMVGGVYLWDNVNISKS